MAASASESLNRRHELPNFKRLLPAIPTHIPSRHISLVRVSSNFRMHVANSSTSPCSPLKTRVTRAAPGQGKLILAQKTNPFSHRLFPRAHSYWTRKSSRVRCENPRRNTDCSTEAKGCSAGRLLTRVPGMAHHRLSPAKRGKSSGVAAKRKRSYRGKRRALKERHCPSQLPEAADSRAPSRCAPSRDAPG